MNDFKIRLGDSKNIIGQSIFFITSISLIASFFWLGKKPLNKKDFSESEALPISTSLSFSAGLSKELNDSKGKNGFFSVKDMISNFAGLFVAISIINN